MGVKRNRAKGTSKVTLAFAPRQALDSKFNSSSINRANMNAKCAATTTSTVRTVVGRSRLAVRVSASSANKNRMKQVIRKELPKIEAACIVGAATLTASPAFALVDKRLNGDGTRLPFGINDPILGWVLFGVFGAVWAVFSQGVQATGGGDEDGEDSGMSL